jgi:hypothetical protein
MIVSQRLHIQISISLTLVPPHRIIVDTLIASTIREVSCRSLVADRSKLRAKRDVAIRGENQCLTPTSVVAR